MCGQMAKKSLTLGHVVSVVEQAEPHLNVSVTIKKILKSIIDLILQA